MIKIKSFTFNPFQENTYVLYDDSKEAVIIDPGCYEQSEKEVLIKFISDNELKPVKLLNTHGHIDHVLGNSFVKKEFDLKLTIGNKDLETLESVAVYAANYGFQMYEPAVADVFIEEGDLINFGQSQLKVIFLPGHAPGHLAFYNTEQNICIGGDVLFEGSIGRTDLPGGDFDTLINSIKSKLFKFADEMVVYPGHGNSTTLGQEKHHNPFCAIY
jgi:glyoxylase-like metal-dependent hydrolase (beta-lactamase superfamily II)